MMGIVMPAAAVAVVLFVAVAIFAVIQRGKMLRVSQKPILTPNEMEFFGRLREALPDYEVFPQVAMGAVLTPGVSGGRDFHRIRGTFAQKIIDFTVCHRDSFKIVTLIELDDRSHNKSKDAHRDAITGAAGIPTIRWESRNRPSISEIRRAVVEIAKRQG